MMRDPEMLFEVSESANEMELSSFLKRPPLNKNCAARLAHPSQLILDERWRSFTFLHGIRHGD